VDVPRDDPGAGHEPRTVRFEAANPFLIRDLARNRGAVNSITVEAELYLPDEPRGPARAWSFRRGVAG
jgi:hypothetical protein